ncbi:MULTISPECIES: hypothetical protein [Mesorhizobium]|uniref:hypothetical protein n=1 Tax=Mesorhizobium TaxID=68287 RepID=UPI0010A9795D|nr:MULTISPECIES: hypothetical protein [Mesorhizobium]
MKQLIWRALFLVGACLTATQSGASDYDICREPLKESLKSIIERRNDLTEYQSTKAWFCSDKFYEDIKSRGGNINLSIPVKDKSYSLVGGFESDDSHKSREAFCSDSSAEFSRDSMDYLYVSVADKEAFSSFNQCIDTIAQKNPADLLQLTARDEGSFVFFTVKFTPPVGVTIDDPMVSSLVTSGGTCSGDLAVGAKINREGRALVCTRNPKDELSFAVFTDRGARFDKVAGDRHDQIAGACDIWDVKSQESWVENGVFSTAAWTADLNCDGGCDDWEKRSGVNWSMSVAAANGQKVGDFISLYCDKARPDVDGTPCAFSSVVAGPTSDGATGSITVRTWSGPVLLVPSWKRLDRKVDQVPEKAESRQLHYGETFEVSADRNNADTYLECTLDGHKATYHPAQDVGDKYLELTSTKPTPETIVYNYRVLR